MCFRIKKYQLASFFEVHDLEYDTETIIRREISPSGKSRAFVNDSPVTLSVLQLLKEQLIDVHSQHQTAELSNMVFQFFLLDTLANNTGTLTLYTQKLQKYQQVKKELTELEVLQHEAEKQHEYTLYLYTELQAASLQVGEQEDLEQQVAQNNNQETIQESIAAAFTLASHEEVGVQTNLHALQNHLKTIAPYATKYQELLDRVCSLEIELTDVVLELENAHEQTVLNPAEALAKNERLQHIYDLQKKHQVTTVAALLTLQESLGVKVGEVLNASEILESKQQQVKDLAETLDVLAAKLTVARKKIIPSLQQQLELILADVGMPNAQFLIELLPVETYATTGKDQLSFLFSANKGASFGLLKKVASGGELSRVMLAVKKLLSTNAQLPTIIFDEIDTGVSGEIATKMGAIMQQMSSRMQVLSITHLPQIAAKGLQHYKVFKEEQEDQVYTRLKELSSAERIVEIAEMLSGKEPTKSALAHAKTLLK